MNRIPNPIYENTSGKTSLSLVSTILITGGLFLLIPITQLSSEWLQRPPEEEHPKTVVIKPPPLLPEPEKVEDPPEPIDENIDLKVDHPPITLTQLNLIFGEGKGDGAKFFSDLTAPQFGQEPLIFDSGQLDVPPKVTAFAAPVYPIQLKQQRMEGRVEVVYLVTEKGKVQDISIRHATHHDFATSVRDALRRASFEPGKIDNKAVITRVRQTFNFNLKG